MISKNIIYKLNNRNENTTLLKRITEIKKINSKEVVNLTVITEGDMKKSIYDPDNDGIVDLAKDLSLSNEDWTQFNLILLS